MYNLFEQMKPVKTENNTFIHSIPYEKLPVPTKFLQDFGCVHSLELDAKHCFFLQVVASSFTVAVDILSILEQSHAPIVSTHGKHRASLFITIFVETQMKIVDSPDVFDLLELKEKMAF
jgi:hypothetical protein